jgi:hypothetical protein
VRVQADVLVAIWLSSVTNDAFRTLATDQDFKDKVSEEALVRLLDAFAWSHLGQYGLAFGHFLCVFADPVDLFWIPQILSHTSKVSSVLPIHLVLTRR